MADRRSLFSRFWPAASTSPRRPSKQTIAPPPASPSPTPTTQDHQTAEQPKSASSQAQPAIASTKATSPSSSIEPKTTSPSSNGPIDEPKATSPSSIYPKDEPKTTSPSPTNPPQTPTPSSTNPTDKPKTSPSRQSPSPSKPTSPIHRVAKSRSPPHPSSPAPQAQLTGSQTPKRASQPRLKSPSPKVGPSSSPKSTQLKSPSKESRQPTQHISPTSQQEPLLNPELETDSANDDFNEKTLNAKPEEAAAGDVKEEVVQATNTEANEETKKKKGKSGSEEDKIIEKTEIPSKRDQQDQVLQRDEQDTKEALGNTKNSHSKIIRSTHNKSAPSNGEHTLLHKNIKDNTDTIANQMTNGDPKGVISDKHVSVVTLAGENRGASMQMEESSYSKREGAVHIHRSYKINPDETPTDGEGNSDGKKSEDAKSIDDQPTETYVNNNSQGINNSIVFNSSISEGNSGVHMVVNHLPKEPIQSKSNAHFPETRKAEFNTTHTEKLTYQPTVRRRCLKGLFLETSDSDPEKPRRHGCRVGCEKRDKENNLDVL